MGEFGLHALQQSANARADLVLVHGLQGRYKATWTHQNGQCWPEWLARKYPHANIWLADYGTSLSGWLQPVLPVEDIGRALLSHAADLGLGRRPIHWVGHSMGGLVTKHMLCQARTATEPRWAAISTATRAVTFLGTPHHGADMATWKSYFEEFLQAADLLQTGGSVGWVSRLVSKVFGERHSQVDALSRHAPALGRLNADFAEWLTAAQSSDQPFRGRNYTEGLPVFKVVMVVPQAAASLHNPRVRDIPTQADHFSICKFASAQDPVFVGIDDDFSALLTLATPDTAPPRVMRDEETPPRRPPPPRPDRSANLTELAWREGLAECSVDERAVLARGLIRCGFLADDAAADALAKAIAFAFERQEPVAAVGRLQSGWGQSRTTLFAARGGEVVRQEQITEVLALLLIHAATLWSDSLIGNEGEREALRLHVPCAQNSLAVVIAAHALFGQGVRVSRRADGRVVAENALDVEALPDALAVPLGRQDDRQDEMGTLSNEIRAWLARTRTDPLASAVKSPLKSRLDAADTTLHARPVVIDAAGTLPATTVAALREQLGVGVATLARESLPPHIDPASWNELCRALESSLLRAASAAASPPPPSSPPPPAAAADVAPPGVQVNFTVNGAVGQLNSTTGAHSAIHAHHAAGPAPTATASPDRVVGAFRAFELVMKVRPDGEAELEGLSDLRVLVESRDAGPTATRQLPRLVQRLKTAAAGRPELHEPWADLVREVQAHWPDVASHFR